MKCPNCKLENMPDALRCDCGYDFESGEIKESYAGNAPEKKSLIISIVGFVIFIICFFAAKFIIKSIF